ncbi:MAG: hypothetical protein ACRDRL_30320 [Sciscionella sp.]
MIHTWRSAVTHDHVTLTIRMSGSHSVTESGSAPLYDRLSQLAGMWIASAATARTVLA